MSLAAIISIEATRGVNEANSAVKPEAVIYAVPRESLP
jgi:hypothetical protein